jgi:hypothetical protein
VSKVAFHPAAVQARLRKKAADRSTLFEGCAWKESFGFLVTMKRDDGTPARYDAANYEEAVALRDQLFRLEPRFVVGWVMMKTYAPPERGRREDYRPPVEDA